MQGIDVQEWKQVTIGKLRSNWLCHGACKDLQVDPLQIVRVTFTKHKYHLVILAPWFVRHFYDFYNP